MAGTIVTRPVPPGRWSAWIPIAIPVFLLLLVLRHVGIHGAVGAADEGTEAHLFQLLLPVQVVVMAYFALTSVARGSRGAMAILAVQIAATIALLVAVYWVDHLPLTG